MRPFFSSSGGIGATVEAARGRSAAAPCLASVQEEEDDGGWFGRDGGLGRPGGRGPVGRGGKIGRLEKKEWATAGPKGRMGRKLRIIISE
jgi:hypothetical protein